MAKATAKPEEKPQPAFKDRLGPLTVTVWKNTHKVDGEDRTFNATTLSRSWADQNNDWHETTQLRDRDIGDAIALLQRVQMWRMSGNVE